MKTFKKQAESISEMKRQRTINRNGVLVTVLLFVALLVGGGTSGQGPDARDLAWVGLTIVAFAGLLWAHYVAYKQSDERQQLVQLKAASLAFMITLFAAVIAQMLEAVNIVALDKTIQVVIIGGVLVWIALLKTFEHRSY